MRAPQRVSGFGYAIACPELSQLDLKQAEKETKTRAEFA
jgi:hypothetical protein